MRLVVWVACATLAAIVAPSRADNPLAQAWIDTRRNESEGSAEGAQAVCARWAKAPEDVQRDGSAGLFLAARQTLALAAAHRVAARIIVHDVALAEAPGRGLAHAWCSLLVSVPNSQDSAVGSGLVSAVASARGAKAGPAQKFVAGVPGPLNSIECGMHGGWGVVSFGEDGWRLATSNPVPGEGLFAVRLDFNRLRASASAAWNDADAGPRLLEALGLANARWAELVVAPAAGSKETAPRLLTATLSWSARNEPTTSRQAMVFGEDAWPADLHRIGAAPEAAIVLRADTLGPAMKEGSGWAAWLRSAIDAAGAFASPQAAATLKAWRLRRGEAIRGFGASLGRWCVVQLGAQGADAGEIRLVTPMKSVPAAERQLALLLGDAGAVVMKQGPWWRLAPDAAAWLSGGVAIGLSAKQPDLAAVMVIRFGQMAPDTPPGEVDP